MNEAKKKLKKQLIKQKCKKILQQFEKSSRKNVWQNNIAKFKKNHSTNAF